jgi:hypothetical protein
VHVVNVEVHEKSKEEVDSLATPRNAVPIHKPGVQFVMEQVLLEFPLLFSIYFCSPLSLERKKINFISKSLQFVYVIVQIKDFKSNSV